MVEELVAAHASEAEHGARARIRVQHRETREVRAGGDACCCYPRGVDGHAAREIEAAGAREELEEGAHVDELQAA